MKIYVNEKVCKNICRCFKQLFFSLVEAKRSKKGWKQKKHFSLSLQYIFNVYNQWIISCIFENLLFTIIRKITIHTQINLIFLSVDLYTEWPASSKNILYKNKSKQGNSLWTSLVLSEELCYDNCNDIGRCTNFLASE